MASFRDQDKLALFGGKPKDATDFSRPKPKQDALGNKILDPEEELRLIERELMEVKVAFDQFFLGFERKSPLRRRDVLGERIRKFRSHLDSKTPAGFRFRLDQAQAKFAAYDRIWNRNMQDKEAGRDSRDLFKLKMKQKKAGEETMPPAPKAAPKPPPSALTPGQLKTLYDTFVIARQRTNEPTNGLSMETLGKTLEKQVPALLKQFNCEAVDFKVVIKNNKAVLKAVPRK